MDTQNVSAAATPPSSPDTRVSGVNTTVSVPNRAPAPALRAQEKAAPTNQEDLARLTEMLRSSGVKELNNPQTYLRISVAPGGSDMQIAVLSSKDNSVVRLIPPSSVREMVRPDVFPRGLLLRLVHSG